MKKLPVNILLLLLVPLYSWATPGPDTGQTKCYDNSQEITCPQPGEPFYGQDAQYPCNPHSYTSLSGGMVQDNVTGLIWQKDTAPGTYTWQQAISYCENLTLGGYSDWRLPTVKELSGIVDSSIPDPGPTINTDYFPNTQSSFYWSSNSYVFVPEGAAWGVYFYNGGFHISNMPYKACVRAVRGGQSNNNFIDNDNGTVTDTDTGLMWEKECAPGTYTWHQALSYCDNLTLSGYNDWRLPNRNELQSIVDYNRYNPSIDPVFPNTQSSFYWSSTTCALVPYSAWAGNFLDGTFISLTKNSTVYYVRAVRAGQCEAFITTTTSVSPGTTTTTTTTATIQPCPAKSIFGEFSEETELLRNFRDDVLSQTPEGRELMKLYYQWSPAIVKAMEDDEEFKAEIKGMIDAALPMIKKMVE